MRRHTPIAEKSAFEFGGSSCQPLLIISPYRENGDRLDPSIAVANDDRTSRDNLSVLEPEAKDFSLPLGDYPIQAENDQCF
jgi:hypothetical protein